MGRRRRGGYLLYLMHCRSRVTIDPPSHPLYTLQGDGARGRHRLLAPSAKRNVRCLFGESHEGYNIHAAKNRLRGGLAYGRQRQ